MRMSLVRGAGIAAVLIVFSLPLATAEETAEEHTAADWPLVGTWHGSGTLMGSRADLFARWSETLDGRFVRLEYRTRRYTDEGERQFDATAFYRPDGETARGHWYDSWGNVTELNARMDGNRVTVEWRSDDGRGGSQAGTTEYVLKDDDTLEVRDFAQTPNGPTEFGSAIYHRVDSDAPPPGDDAR